MSPHNHHLTAAAVLYHQASTRAIDFVAEKRLELAAISSPASRRIVLSAPRASRGRRSVAFAAADEATALCLGARSN